MKPISEEDVQQAIAQVFASDLQSLSAFLGHLSVPTFTVAEEVSMVDIRTNVSSYDGETDIQLDVVNKGGARLRSLIEVKLAANFQIHQGRRYASRARSQGMACLSVRTVLLAPLAYLRTANPEARLFDISISLEDLLAHTTSAAPQIAVALIREAAARVNAGAPLGAKGLFPKFYNAVAQECDSRGNDLRIINRPTAWMSLKHPLLPSGVNLNYRVPAAVAEVRVLSSFRGNRQGLSRADQRGEIVRSGGELFLRLPTLTVDSAALRGDASIADIKVIVDAFEELLQWWRRASAPNE